MTKHILIAEEFNIESASGSGHGLRLSSLAKALLDSGCGVTLVLRHLEQASVVLDEVHCLTLQAPVSLPITGQDAVSVPISASCAGLLHASGYFSSTHLFGLISGWQSIFDLVDPDLVLMIDAPTALLAADIYPFKKAWFGSGGFGARGMMSPSALDDIESVDHTVLQVVNAVRLTIGSRPLRVLTDLFKADINFTTPKQRFFSSGDIEQMAQQCINILVSASEELSSGQTIKAETALPECEKTLQKIEEANQAKAKGNARAAIDVLLEIVQAEPGSGAAYAALGSAYLDIGAYADASAALQTAVRLVPDDPATWMNMGALEERRNRLDEACHCFDRAAQLIPADTHPLLALLQVQKKRHDVDGAIRSANHLIALEASVEHLLVKSELLIAANRLAEAESIFEELLLRRPLNPVAVEQWFNLLAQKDRFDELSARLLALDKEMPNTGILLVLLASAYSRLWQYDKALDAYSRAHALEPYNAHTMHGLGVVNRDLGRLGEASTWFQRALQLNPVNAHTLRMFGADHRYTYGDDAFKRLNTAAAQLSEYAVDGQVQLHFALGKAYEDVEELGTAFGHYAMGGKLQNRIHRYYDGQYESHLQAWETQLLPETIARGKVAGHPSEKPVFVLGMPRSGSTLIEQILASHPQVFGAGELPFLADALQDMEVDGVTLLHKSRHEKEDKSRLSLQERGAIYLGKIEQLAEASCKRIVDKMPANSRWAGLIPLILPNAHIIHSRRHPVEICLSCYRLFFTAGQNFTYDLGDLGRAYRTYHASMQLWRKVLPPGRILEIRYEEMIDDTEAQARRLVEHIGLPWDDACLRFYETDRPVRTASATQVRKPIYRSSIGRWHKYKPYLGPLLEELGSLIEEYEAELAEAQSGQLVR